MSAREALRFATAHCRMDTDLQRAAAVLGDLFRLTGRRYDAQAFAERALAMLLAIGGPSRHWRRP